MAFVRVVPVGSSKGRRCPLVSTCRTLALEGRSSNVGLGAVGLSPAISVASTWGLPVQGAGRREYVDFRRDARRRQASWLLAPWLVKETKV